jgi:excisionase family DNA binding protein
MTARAARHVMTPAQAALLLGRSKSWVVEKLASGLLPGIRDGNRWLVRRADLLRDGWIVDGESGDGGAAVRNGVPVTDGDGGRRD